MEQTIAEHPDLDTLELYALLRLAGEPERAVEQHVFLCSGCQRKVIYLVRQAHRIRAAFALSASPSDQLSAEAALVCPLTDKAL